MAGGLHNGPPIAGATRRLGDKTHMRRMLLAAVFTLTACSGTTSTLHLALTSDDTAAPATTGTPPPPTGTSPSSGTDTLATAAHVNVTVTEVDVHVAGADDTTAQTDAGTTPTADGGTDAEASDEVRGEDVPDTGAGWQTVSTTAQSIDLMALQANATQAIGDVTVPSGKITQVRLKLKTDSTQAEGEDVISGAVTDSTGQVCDLLVPHSAVNPGIKIIGLFRAAKINGGSYQVVVNLRKSDSQKVADAATCTYRLNPVIELKSVQRESGGSAQ